MYSDSDCAGDNLDDLDLPPSFWAIAVIILLIVIVFALCFFE